MCTWVQFNASTKYIQQCNDGEMNQHLRAHTALPGG